MSAISSTTGGLINFNGLASGVNTNNIIQGLELVNQKQISNLTSQQNSIQTVQSSFATISSGLSSLQSSLEQLTSTVNGALGGLTATTSDKSVLTAAADSTAQAGTYSLTVDNLAQSEQLATSGVTSLSSSIQQGTLQLQVGSGASTTITIDNSNNTLQGLASAINSSGSGIQASIVNDGSSSPYRLLLTSSETGSANAIQVTNNLTSGTGASINFNQVIQPATDAQVSLGSGAGALTFTSPTNTFNNTIAGVTLNVQQADPNSPQTLTIAPNTSTASTAIQGFVTAYNAIIDYISQNSTVGSTSGGSSTSAGVLLGNTDAEQLQGALQNILSGSVAGVNPKANSLASIGITFTSTGDLQVNQTTLDQALSGQLPGVSTKDVQALFALTGQSSSPGVSYILGGNNTKPSVSSPYQVNITQAATQASLTAGTPLASTVNIDSSNNNFVINVNGIASSQINLPTGSYTQSQFASLVQSAINSNSQLGANQVTVAVNSSGDLQIGSTAYGSSSGISFSGGTALGSSGPLGFVGTEAANGLNVEGNYIVNGQSEAATGIGQILDGNSGNANTDGLQVQVSLGTSQVGSGIQTNMNVTAGLATQLNQLLTSDLNPSTGEMATINNKLQASITTIGNQITSQNKALTSETTQLSSEFTQMEISISKLQTMGTEMTALLNSNNGGSTTQYGPKSLGGSSSSSSSGGL